MKKFKGRMEHLENEPALYHFALVSCDMPFSENFINPRQCTPDCFLLSVYGRSQPLAVYGNTIPQGKRSYQPIQSARPLALTKSTLKLRHKSQDDLGLIFS